tara:strand:- start:1921 stop:2931 length:1011 start_codon:yes stop_codon:yes gene_type:complete
MIKKSYKLIVAILGLMVLVTACGQGETVTGTPTNPFIGGTSGLVLNFEEGSPPSEVTDTESFPFKVILKLENQGETDVATSDALVSIKGFPPEDFGITDGSKLLNQNPETNLDRKQRGLDGDVVDGGTSFVRIPTGSTDADFLEAKELSGNTEFPIRADICYKYHTDGNARLCILQDLIDVDSNDVCDPNKGDASFSSGSPIQFTNFKQSVDGKDSIRFSFDVVHSGNGEIYEALSTQTTPTCPKDDIRTSQVNENKVRLSIDVGAELGGTSGEGLNCNWDQDGFIRLEGGKRTLTCTIDLTGKHNTDFFKIIELDADFNYYDTKETSILVKHIPN